ncbi:sulfite reductase subunit alpha [Derxia gummosa]|uniref:NADPH--hemoprotein reductase n=1 Tax=Derxia gummosa DSM 723 TaxID=1121388 RepID=A0A8B6X9M0_9BURK|nr:sulfite reductase subunit alpha [Derxia gummosa]
MIDTLLFQPERLGAALGLLLGYGLLCAGCARQARRLARDAGGHARRGDDGTPPADHASDRAWPPASAGPTAFAAGSADPAGPDWLVAYASQTGTVAAWAEQTARLLRAAGARARVASLCELTPAALAREERALILVSTAGQGDPPDDALGFASDCFERDGALALDGLRYGLLAAGDSDYPVFCGFGRWLDHWLLAHGARPCFERVEVDRGDATALALWQRRIGALAAREAGPGTVIASVASVPGPDAAAGTDADARAATDVDDGVAPGNDAATFAEPAFSPWRLVARHRLNPGSIGEPVCHLLLEAPDADARGWQAGDLVELRAPGDGGRARRYTVCNAPGADGRIELLVRRHRRDDGGIGIASGWLTGGLAPGGEVRLRLRAHPSFRIGANAGRPLVLIGSGTGMAGLRAHWQARADAVASAGAAAPAAAPVWLLFGERQRERDAFFADEIAAALADGRLARADLAFSRDAAGTPAAAPRHVQDLLHAEADRLRDWVDAGAALYVCGRLAGMGEGVDGALRELLGGAAVDALARAGRYRRDLY